MPDRVDGKIYPLLTAPGIRRDGTALDGNNYSDGQWCRFRNGRPKKIGGYREICNGLDGPIRGMYVQSNHPMQLIYNFSQLGIQVVTTDDAGVGTIGYDRSFTAGTWDDTLGDVWSFQSGVMYDVTGGESNIVVHPAQNLSAIDSDTDYDAYYGDVLDTADLAACGVQVSGGVCILQPFAFYYGSKGRIVNSDANNPAAFVSADSNDANVAGTKIVKGLPLRGGSSAPAGLFWALDSLIKVSYVPGATVRWRYDTISSETSILSSNGPIEYDGVYYWPGVDRFLMYNGVVKEVPNQLCQDFFFDNLNFTQRQKVWATKVPRWGEIWWFFPKGDVEECNHAVIYNVRENTWYDTPVLRAAGFPARVMTFPTWADSASNDVVSDGTYRIYRHEFGTDAVIGESQTAIRSYFETSQVGFASGGPAGDGTENMNVQTRITKIEPDFVQSGDMSVIVTGTSYAQDDEVIESDPFMFSPQSPFPTPTDGVAQPQAVINTAEQRRLLRLRFESNVAGGNYHAGKVLMHLEPGDERA